VRFKAEIVMMPWCCWMYFGAIFITAILLFIAVYEAILYSDLECDYMNPMDCCRSANALFFPYLAFQALIIFMTGLICLSYLSLLIQGSFMAWMVYRIWNAQQSGLSYLLEPTSIFSKLPELKKYTFAKIAFHLFSFFFYLYMLVSSILTD
jgi:protein cornichon